MLILKIYSLIIMLITIGLNINDNIKNDREKEAYLCLALFLPVLIYILVA